jgi:hypothetical protein
MINILGRVDFMASQGIDSYKSLLTAKGLHHDTQFTGHSWAHNQRILH